MDQTCRCITPQGRTPSTQTFSSLSVFLYIPLQRCYFVSLLNNIKGPPQSTLPIPSWLAALPVHSFMSQLGALYPPPPLRWLTHATHPGGVNTSR